MVPWPRYLLSATPYNCFRSAALGLAIAAAVGFSYSNIFVTSPSPENLHTLFEFIFKGFDAMGYEEHSDYDLVQSTNPEFNNAVVRVNIHEKNNHRQTIQVILGSLFFIF
jgi:N-acetyltransferase 10